MGDMADMANDDRMSEWELATDNEFAPLDIQYELGLCDEYGMQFNPGTVVVDNLTYNRYTKPSGKGKCPLCASDTHLIEGKFGTFYGCNNFPKCKGNRNL